MCVCVCVCARARVMITHNTMYHSEISIAVAHLKYFNIEKKSYFRPNL